MADLNQIYEAIGQLRAKVEHLADEQTIMREHARERGNKIDEKLDDLRSAQMLAIQQNKQFAEDQSDIQTRLKEAEVHIEGYKSLRRWGALVWAGTVSLAGSIGYLAQYVHEWIKKVS